MNRFLFTLVVSLPSMVMPGGIINVTTKGPSRTFGAGIELETSEFLDAYGQSRLGFNIQGPLIKGRNENNTSLLGFFLSGDLNYNRDSRPTATGAYYADDATQQSLQDNPLVPSGLSSGGTYSAGEFVRNENLEHSKAHRKMDNYGVNLSAKIDVRTTKTTNLTFGGQYYYTDGRRWTNGNYSHQMFNYDKNYLRMENTWRVFGRFTQRFPTSNESSSLIKNVYYSIQADYSQYKTSTMDPDHKEDLFKYGYLGQYTTYKIPTYALQDTITVNGTLYENAYVLNSWDFDTAYVFNPASYNPYIANYTSSIYDLFPTNWDFYPFGVGNWSNEDQLTLRGGLLNGQTDNSSINGGKPDAYYGMWNAPGTIQTRYGITQNNQISLNVSAAADIGNHELKFGFLYEQRIERGYSYIAPGLWTRMRQLTNAHIESLDIENPVPIFRDGVFQDTVLYYRKYDPITQTTFDRNLRKKLGLPEQGLDFILVDSYDIDKKTILYYDKDGNMHSVKMNDDLYSIDMFSADELLFDGSFVAFYQGFDYKGNKLTTKPSFEDFFNEKNEEGDYTRPIGAYEPIYMAGYIQDKFAFKDLIFNVGVRVDRFDANQPVLKDPFLLFPAYTVDQVDAVAGEPVSHPGNMGDDYVVYVNNSSDPSDIVGYRNEYTWYNANGVEIQDLSILGPEAGPLLVDPSQKKSTDIDIRSFTDYEPQISVMPRISFSFPISDEALFFAHYDVLTQRPLGNEVADPSIYFYLDNIGFNIANPNLKPTKTIDYELGFQQKLTMKSSLKLTVFYREMRDDIQVYRFSGAFPKEYTSYNNIDFGTVKGLTVTYDLRRLNSNIRLNASYTLQFANGTGSSSTTAAALVASGLPNLRTTNPLNWDRRHNFNISVDYRFGEGKEYNGPTITSKKGTDNEKVNQILKNTGVNFTVTGGSGTPYTAQENIVAYNSGGTRVLKGTINGSRLPWQFKIDMRLDKEFHPKWGKNNREVFFDVYLQILNLLNTSNILGVYPATGNPDDDGYLAAAEWQTEINQQVDPQAYRDLYTQRISVPWNLSTPRQIRLGLQFNF
ncbi:MAG: hypothetical protein R2764_09080 [Bacteroidales bacterium]